jgi:ERCC4-related helicase
MKNRKVLILVNTIEWSRLLLKSLFEFGISDTVRASYGGGKFEGYNEGGIFSDTSDVMKKFSDGDFNILIGTTHLYEGVDVPNLDVIILAFGGKKDRLQLQGIGRALRKTKSGKYAYIVDFTDHIDTVLRRQSNIRYGRYTNDLRIPQERMFDCVKLKDLEIIFNQLEEIN